jgi:hypothetical protein
MENRAVPNASTEEFDENCLVVGMSDEKGSQKKMVLLGAETRKRVLSVD